MVKVAIVNSSINGDTKSLTERVLKGIQSVEGVEGKVFTAEEALDRDVLEDLCENYTAIIFGTPTLMGSPSAKFKEFMERSADVYFRKLWINKIGGAFTVSAGRSGSKVNTLVDLAVFAAQHGMVWVPLTIPPGYNMSTQKGEDCLNASGFFFGVGAQANVDQDGSAAPAEHDLKTGELYGTRLAQFAKEYEPTYQTLKAKGI
jgi:multimeric flavodoxin WrbA